MASIIKAAICDDCTALAEKTERDLRKIFTELGAETQIEVYGKGEDLQNDISGGERFDLIFLDIELVTISGIDVGKFIRNGGSDYSTQIVFISSHPSYALALFDVSPLDFLVKPLEYERLRKVCVKFLKMRSFWSDNFSYKVGRDLYAVKISDIVYMKSDKRQITLYLSDGRTDAFYGKLDDIYTQELKGRGFLRIHNSVIVNYNHIREFEYETLKVSDGTVLKITRERRKDVRQVLEEFENRGLYQ